ncbi:MAG: polyketide synthase dehydratase domain-containing protein, partial [Candidatus Angelobacter sp.]
MIDFFEYVVAELKSKRLSKTNAVELVRQFSGRSSNSPAASIIHPLLHLNTSDLSEQRYTSTFTGEEFFLADHQVKLREGSGQKVLPGAAYLEMARAATEQALSGRGSPAVLDLQGVVWAQPAIVSGKKELNIALWEIENQQIEYEVYSWNADQKMVHCHGRVGWSFKAVLARLDIELLRKRMQQGTLQSGSIYAAFTEMNMAYGPGFQAVTAIYQGNGEVLAHLKLPKILECKYEDYVLHPSLIDSAFQACLGLAKGSTKVSNETRLPYAVESVRIIAPCTKDMFAWARYADGSEAENNLAKVDIDLCDEQGNICVQIQGFSYRILKSEKRTPADHRQGSQAELQSFIPVWKPAHAEIHKHLSDSTRVLLLGGDQADLDWVKRSHANASLVSFSTGATTDIIEAKL